MKMIFSEHSKVKHTPFLMLHICLPLIAALLFVSYYLLYRSTPNAKKLTLILEITASFFPLLISVVVSMNIALEEKASHFQAQLAVPNRAKTIVGKLLYLYGAGIAALAFLFLVFSIGVWLFGLADAVQFKLLCKALLGIAWCHFVIYLLHLFLSLKFGFGVSLFCGGFECLQSILYSNIELKGAARSIPFAWSMAWIQDVLNDRISVYQTEWICFGIIIIALLYLFLIWFSHWEGRKNGE